MNFVTDGRKHLIHRERADLSTSAEYSMILIEQIFIESRQLVEIGQSMRVGNMNQ